MIEPQRIHCLKEGNASPAGPVVYWMQQSQRAEYNHALDYAALVARERHIPLRIVFVVVPGFLQAQSVHYRFMLEGLIETDRRLRSYGHHVNFLSGSPEDLIPTVCSDASCLITDAGYLKIQRRWRHTVSERVNCPVYEIESDTVVPVETLSDHREYMARTIRPKLKKLVNEYLHYSDKQSLMKYTQSAGILNESTLPHLPEADHSSRFRGGRTEALRLLNFFVDENLQRYAADASKPEFEVRSMMSPYLHFGQISPLEIIHQIRNANGISPDSKSAFLEELIVRRELAVNFVRYTPDYDSLDALPEWVRLTLEKHASDPRPYLYSETELETASTHDPYWNAAMHEMKDTGYMHGYMRMYWGKKIIEWTPDPHTAYRIIISLNNKWFIDGRDPNSYANVLWLFGLHDQAWKERPVFGKIRYMNAAGLKRKFKMDHYLNRVGQPQSRLSLF